MLDVIKTKRAQAALNCAPLQEVAAPKHLTPPFVQHCVAAITGDPEKMKAIKGSPFGICWAQYKKSGEPEKTQTPKKEREYEKALTKLHQETAELRASHPPRREIVFGPSEVKQRHREIRFVP